MEPTVLFSEPTETPTSSWLRRGLDAIFIERRMPYQIERRINRLCRSAGIRLKKVKIDGLTVVLRRLTQDEEFVANILLGSEYIREGFEIRPTDTVIDIGGNIGAFALRAARLAREGHIFCYEPHGENFTLLQKNISRNRISNISAFRSAVAGKAGSVRLFAGGETGLHSMLAERAVDDRMFEDVRCITLEMVFEENEIDRCQFLKIDCEGAEYEILYNTPRRILERIDKIAMEYHSSTPKEKRSLSSGLVSFLENHGFQVIEYIDYADFDCGFIRATREPTTPL